MIAIYILKLQHGKFYVDRVDNISKSKKINFENLEKKIMSHFDGFGIDWTRKYKPISIYKIHYNCTTDDENKYTKIMMMKYGIENVRGDLYDKIEINDIQKMILKNEIM